MTKYIYVHVQDNNPIADAQKIKLNDINLISNGSSEHIICDCLDVLPINDRINATKQLLNKIKIGGKLHLRFINLNLFAKHCYLNKIDNDKINGIIANVRSLINDSHIESITNTSNFRIHSLYYDGIVENVILERQS